MVAKHTHKYLHTVVTLPIEFKMSVSAPLFILKYNNHRNKDYSLRNVSTTNLAIDKRKAITEMDKALRLYPNSLKIFRSQRIKSYNFYLESYWKFE